MSRLAAPPLAAQQRSTSASSPIDARIGDGRVRSSGTVIDAEPGLSSPRRTRLGRHVAAADDRPRRPARPDRGRARRAPTWRCRVAAARPRPRRAADGGRRRRRPSDLLTAVGRRAADPDLGTGSLVTIPTRTAKAGVTALARRRAAVRSPGRSGSTRRSCPSPRAARWWTRTGELVGIAMATDGRHAGGGAGVALGAR